MWLPIIICSLATAVISGKSPENGINILRNDVQWKKADFENRIRREFEGTNGLRISFMEENIVNEIAAIGNKDSTTLRDLKLAEEPKLKITSINSTLEYFSMRICIAADDLVFSGKIYVNEDTEPSGDVRYAMTNVKGSGLVGLGLGQDGKFVPTNYFMNYNDDSTGFQLTRDERNFHKPELCHPQFSELQLKTGFRKLINTWLKNRLYITLARISLPDIIGTLPSNVLQISDQFSSFYDNVVDNILNIVNKQVEDNNMDELKLPSFEFPFSYKILGFGINGKVQAAEGWIRGLTTLIRRGSTSLSFESGHFSMFGSVGMAKLEVGCNSTAIKVAGIGPSAGISAKIGRNSANMNIWLDVINRNISLASFELTDLGDFDIKWTGLGPFNWLASKITNTVMEKMKTNFIPTIETIIKQQIRLALGTLDVGEIIKKIGS